MASVVLPLPPLGFNKRIERIRASPDSSMDLFVVLDNASIPTEGPKAVEKGCGVRGNSWVARKPLNEVLRCLLATFAGSAKLVSIP